MSAVSPKTNEDHMLSNSEKLIYMANQIAQAFAAQGEEAAVAQTADHIQKFWTPQMRRDLMALAKADDSTFRPALKKALPLVKVPVG